MRKLHLAAEVFAKLGFHRILAAYSGMFSKKVPVLTYHRVGLPVADYPFDKGLYSATIEEFTTQMNYIKANYSPLTMTQMIAYINGEFTLPKNPILITFDDGFEDNYRLAFPILKARGIPATFFVTTDFIGSNETLWYERLAYFFNRVEVARVKIDALSLDLPIRGKRSRTKAYLKTVERLKLVKNKERLAILVGIYEEYGDPYVYISQDELELSKSMSWEQLKEMLANGMDIGAHSISHPILSMLDESEIEHEIVGCKKLIELQLGCNIDSIAYPVGQHESYSPEVIEQTVNAGYKIGFSFVDGVGCPSKYSIERLHVDIHAPFSLFKSKIAFPRLFCE